MVDEGLAREVVNRVQRLRKKAKLQPSDEVTVQYIIEPSGHDLTRVIKEHQDYIEASTKNAMIPQEAAGEAIEVEQYDLEGAKMTLKIWKPSLCGEAATASIITLKNHGTPQVPFINVVSGKKAGVVLLENPIGSNKLTSWQQVAQDVGNLLSSPLKTSPDNLFSDAKCSVKVCGNISDFNGRTIFLSPTKVNVEGACCPFVNIDFADKKGCFLLVRYYTKIMLWFQYFIRLLHYCNIVNIANCCANVL